MAVNVDLTGLATSLAPYQEAARKRLESAYQPYEEQLTEDVRRALYGTPTEQGALSLAGAKGWEWTQPGTQEIVQKTTGDIARKYAAERAQEQISALTTGIATEMKLPEFMLKEQIAEQLQKQWEDEQKWKELTGIGTAAGNVIDWLFSGGGTAGKTGTAGATASNAAQIWQSLTGTASLPGAIGGAYDWVKSLFGDTLTEEEMANAVDYMSDYYQRATGTTGTTTGGAGGGGGIPTPPVYDVLKNLLTSSPELAAQTAAFMGTTPAALTEMLAQGSVMVAPGVEAGLGPLLTGGAAAAGAGAGAVGSLFASGTPAFTATGVGGTAPFFITPAAKLAGTAVATGATGAGAATAGGFTLPMLAGPGLIAAGALMAIMDAMSDVSGPLEDARAAAAMRELQQNPALVEQAMRDPFSVGVDYRQAMENLEGVPNAQAIRDQFVANLGGTDLRWPGGPGEMMGTPDPAITAARDALIPAVAAAQGSDLDYAQEWVGTLSVGQVAQQADFLGVPHEITADMAQQDAMRHFSGIPEAGGG